MREAIVRVNPDPEGRLGLAHVVAVRAELLRRGIPVVPADLSNMHAGQRELELILSDTHTERVRRRALQVAKQALQALGVSSEPVVGIVTFKSAGTTDDALAIFRSFGVRGEVRRIAGLHTDTVVFLVGRKSLANINESQLLTALRSGLNQDVVIVTEWTGPTQRLAADNRRS